MNFIRGGELFTHLRNVRRFKEDQAKFYINILCLAIGYLHSKSIIHRDLKCENILMDNDGYIKLTDFGVAKDISKSGEAAMTFTGTFDYLAPELLDGEPYGKPVDWWAIGVLTYELIVGFPTFLDVSS